MSSKPINQQRVTIQRRFLPYVVKPARYLALQWPGYAELSGEVDRIGLIVGANYEKVANDPLLSAIGEALANSGRFNIGSCFSFPDEALTLLREVGVAPFVGPSLTALDSAALLVVPLERYQELPEAGRLLSAAGVSLDVAVRKERGAPPLIAVVRARSYPEVLDQIFDRVFSLGEFERAISNAQSAAEILQATDSNGSAQAEGSAYYPAQPVTPLTETSYERARVAFRAGVDAESVVSTVGNELSGALRRSGQTEFHLEQCALLRGRIDLGELCAATNTGLSSAITGVTLSQVAPEQVNARLLAALSRFRRARIELSCATLSSSCADYSKTSLANLNIALQSVFSAADVHCKLTVALGYPVDADVEINETVNALRELGRVIDRRRGLKVRFVRFEPEPSSAQAFDAQISAAELDERFQRVISLAKVKGMSFSLADQFSELFSLALSRGFWKSPGELAEFCARKEPGVAARWSELLLAEPGWESALSEQPGSGADQPETIAPERAVSERSISESIAIDDVQPVDVSSGFGRSKKRSARQTVAAPTMGRVRFTWSKSGAAKFLSHLDNLRAIEGALLRSGLNVAYTQGQKPRMKISFGPPLPVGFTSENELFDVFFETAPPASELVEKLNQALPNGFSIRSAESVYTKAPSALEEVKAADYLIAIEDKSAAETQEILERVICSEELMFVRVRKSTEKRINLRAGLFAAELAQNCSQFAGLTEGEPVVIKLSLALTDTFYVRPEEFLIASGLIDKRSAPGALIHRLKLQTTTQRALPVLTTEQKQ